MGIKSNRTSESYFNFFGASGPDAVNAAPLGPFSATGGNVPAGIEPGNGYKYHVFTSPGSLVCTGDPNPVEYVVVAGGGSGGVRHGSGGGAGGLRTNVSGDPKAGGSLSIGAGTHPITVGEGGASNPNPPGPALPGLPGTNSVFDTITSSGGGGARMHGGNPSPAGDGEGGSGGGTSNPTDSPTYGQGNIPPVSPPQGNNGGYSSVNSGHNYAGNGGNGHPISAFSYPLISPGIPGPMQPTFGPACGPTGLYGGGGGGGNWDTGYSYAGSGGGGSGSVGEDSSPGPNHFGEGGPGGGGDGTNAPGTAGAGINGGGGGGGGHPIVPGAGGDGIVIIRYAI